MSKPIFGLTAVPLSGTEVPDLFGAKDRPVVRVLDNPPVVRPHGFDLEHGTSSKIVAGKLRRAGIDGYKVLELWKDGTLIFATNAYDFLCWWNNRPPNGVLRINPLVLCESTYNFACLSQKIYAEAKLIPSNMEYGILLRDIVVSGQRAELTPELSWFLPFNIGKSPEGEPTKEAFIQWDGPELNPGQIAYRLVREIYRWFEMTDDKVPFTSTSNTGYPEIDPEKISAVDRPTAKSR